MAKAKQAGAIVLDRGDYFELRTLIRDVEAIELDMLRAAEQFKARREQARQKGQARFEAIAKAYQFDPTVEYRWDDATCALIPTKGDDR